MARSAADRAQAKREAIERAEAEMRRMRAELKELEAAERAEAQEAERERLLVLGRALEAGAGRKVGEEEARAAGAALAAAVPGQEG